MGSNYSRARRSGRHAFTLIELLVVVAIIVVLIAVLLPSLGRAREQSKIVSCGSNMRQIALSMHMYGQENQDIVPLAFYVFNGGATKVTWDSLINQQLNGQSSAQSVWTGTVGSRMMKSLSCPADTALRPSYARELPRSYFMVSPWGGSGAVTAGMGRFGYESASTIPPPVTLKFVSVANPGATAMLLEAHQANNYAGDHNAVWDAVNPGSALTGNASAAGTTPWPMEGGAPVPPVHLKKLNWAFADGHVEWLHPSQTVATSKRTIWSTLAGWNCGGMWTLNPDD